VVLSDTAGVDDSQASAESLNWLGVPSKVTITIKEISDNRYYYRHWREGNKMKSRYRGAVIRVSRRSLGRTRGLLSG